MLVAILQPRAFMPPDLVLPFNLLFLFSCNNFIFKFFPVLKALLDKLLLPGELGWSFGDKKLVGWGSGQPPLYALLVALTLLKSG